MSKSRKEKISEKGKKNMEGWVKMGDPDALEICMIAIQLALCMQFGTLCIQLSHLYSAPKLDKASFKLEPQYERSVLPVFFERIVGGRHYGKE